MDSTLKYRIVGATVLLALAVIFVPMILDGSGQETVTKMEMDIPPEPTLIFTDEEAIKDKTPAPEYSNTGKTESEPVISIDEDVVPESIDGKETPAELQAWIVQVGAFGEKDKAVAFKDKLVAAKFDALVVAGKNDDKSVYRVKVGPMLTEDEAIKVKDRLAKDMKIEAAFVTRYPQE
ncbi:MAG: SPOR domain-containing protein [Pseudomonadota bacterium]